MRLLLVPPTLILFLAALLPSAEIPDHDLRLMQTRHTDLKYAMPSYDSLDAWRQRAAFLRKQILASAGLLPLPKRTPLNPQVFGKIEGDGYTIEKVLLETYPGFFLGGNLYRPAGGPGPYPAIVSPHGHWTYGRLENSERGSIPARGINLARQGFVVLTYDMTGYTDTVQTGHSLGGKREELWSIGLLGLQLWNSIRAVDFLASLPDVDSRRIGATGASGGGTQIFLLAAVDDRIRFSAPVNMISSIMQGGSKCENAANLRIDTYNVEIGALMAPRPMIMISASGDWTRNSPQTEYPDIRRIYGLFGAEQELEHVQIDAPHNYNRQSREAVYRFFGKKVLDDPEESHFAETSYRVPQLSAMMSRWDHKLPARAVDEAGLIAYLTGQARRHIAALKPHDADSLRRAQKAFGEALRFSVLAEMPKSEDLVSESVERLRTGETLLLGRRGKGDRVSAVMLEPRRSRAGVLPTLLIHPEGTAWALSSSESQGGLVRQLLARGGPLMAIDAFQTGRSKGERPAPEDNQRTAFFTTFNRTDDANRIQDILTAIVYLRQRSGSEEINLVGMGRAGVWTLFAKAMADGPIRLIADLDKFDADSDEEFLHQFFIPGIRKAGGFEAASVLLPGEKTYLHNVASSFPSDWVLRSFQAAEAAENLRIQKPPLQDSEILELLAPGSRRRSGRRR